VVCLGCIAHEDGSYSVNEKEIATPGTGPGLSVRVSIKRGTAATFLLENSLSLLPGKPSFLLPATVPKEVSQTQGGLTVKQHNGFLRPRALGGERRAVSLVTVNCSLVAMTPVVFVVTVRGMWHGESFSDNVTLFCVPTTNA
jgi:hypothetical protein